MEHTLRNSTSTAGFLKLENLIREIQFGTIYGLQVKDGRIDPDGRTRISYTRKPRFRGKATKPETAASPVLHDAMHDLRRDIEDLRGTWLVTVKVTNGLPLSWDREPIGSS